MNLSLKPKVALSQDFLMKLAKLPSSVHSKVLKWTIKFQADPTSSGINYEKIQSAKDGNLRSVRIDQDWRGIVFKPDKGDVYVLLYVDHHDEAYRWAENRKLAINPVTGAMQMVVLEEVTEQQNKQQSAPAMPGQPESAVPALALALFAGLTDRELMSLGVPEESLARVKTISSEAELDQIQPFLPVEAYEGLFLLAAGDTVSQVIGARETRIDLVVDTSDFLSSLGTPESQARFVVVDSDTALTAIMNAPLAQWRVFLHPTQRKLAAGDRSGPVRILGGAGTGKTVLAMHRAKWLAENRTPEGKKVLFTTFTRNLAFDIEENLNSLCSPATMKKIEVRNLDSWVHGFLRSHSYEHSIVYDRRKDAADAWQRALAVKDGALGMTDEFYGDELEQIILAQGVGTKDEYRAARRTGRGVVLSRSKRDAIWPVFEEYRAQLASRKLKEVDDAYKDAALLLANSSVESAYSAIVVDETQDFGPQALRLIRAMVPAAPNDLCFVGDGHQRIYSRHRAAMSRCGIDIRGRSKKLYLNYRTTEQIRLQAVALLQGCEVDDLDDGQDESVRYKSLSNGAVPAFVKEASLESALDCAQKIVLGWAQAADDAHPVTTCVIAASRAVRDRAAKLFADKGMKTHVIEVSKKDVSDPAIVRFSTMHRAKGLEFDQVLALVPATFLEAPADTVNERKLLYVAITRAKRAAGLVVY